MKTETLIFKENLVNDTRILGASTAIFIYIVVSFIYLHKFNKLSMLIELFKNKFYFLNIVIIIVLSIFIIKFDGKGFILRPTNNERLDRLKESIKKAIFGFLIAILAYLDEPLLAFWSIFLVSYYLNGFI